MTQRSLLAFFSAALLLNSSPGCAVAQDEASGDSAAAEATASEPLTWDSLQPELTIGDEAPALDIEHWVQDGGGRFPKVTELSPGKVYVVEFWATWCGPCIASMPHISELQEQYADRDVQVVSISDEDLETVTAFLERQVPEQLVARMQASSEEGDEESADDEAGDDDEGDGEQQPPTFAELTANYCLTTDPDRSAHDGYFKAAGRRGIPCAFIVGKDGKVEWIGHPMGMDEPLEQVVMGSWDREAFRDEFLNQQKLQVALAAINEKASAGDGEGARKLLDQLKETAPEDVHAQLDELAPAIDQMVFRRAVEEDQAKAAKMLPEQIEAMGGSPRAVLQATIPVLSLVLGGDEVSPELSKATIAAAKGALEDAPRGAMEYNLRTLLARLYASQGDYAAAIEQQELLIESAPARRRASLESYLEELKAKQGEDDAE